MNGKTAIILFLLIMYNNLFTYAEEGRGVVIRWDIHFHLPPEDSLPENPGFAGAYSGIVDHYLFLLGGANFPGKKPWEGGTKRWSKTLYSLDLSRPEANEWQVEKDFLPFPAAYGISIRLPEGVLCIGGNEAGRCYDAVWMVTREEGKWCMDTDWPSLPVPLACACGTLLDGKVYILGGQSDMKEQEATAAFFVLDLSRKAEGWTPLPPWPGEARGYAVCVAQNHSVYLFSGRNYNGKGRLTVHRDGFVYHPETGKWEKLTPAFPVMAGVGIPYGTDDILFFGGVEEVLPTDAQHPGFSRTIRCFNVKDQSLDEIGRSPFPIPVTTNVLVDGKTVYITSGEIRPGIRTPFILRGKMIK